MFKYKQYKMLKPYNPIGILHYAKLKKHCDKYMNLMSKYKRNSFFVNSKKRNPYYYVRMELVSWPDLVDYSYPECARYDYVVSNYDNFIDLIKALSFYDYTNDEFDVIMRMISVKNIGILCFHYDESCNMNAVINSIMMSSMHSSDDVPYWIGGYMINSTIISRMNDNECERFLRLYDESFKNDSFVCGLNKISIALFKCSEDLDDSCWNDVIANIMNAYDTYGYVRYAEFLSIDDYCRIIMSIANDMSALCWHGDFNRMFSLLKSLPDSFKMNTDLMCSNGSGENYIGIGDKSYVFSDFIWYCSCILSKYLNDWSGYPYEFFCQLIASDLPNYVNE